jgi:tetratricopeptide (TPR) repeat protein
VPSAHAADTTRILGLTQTRPMPTNAALAQRIAADKKLLCKGRPVRGRVALRKALADAEKLVTAKVGRKAAAELRRSKELKSARGATGVAAGAVASGRPLGAVEALLVAHRREPRNAAHLANLGGIVTMLGKPRDGLAILEAASRLKMPSSAPMGISRKAALQSNRGQALVLLHRYPEAVKALKAATRTAPELSEAHRNLAAAYACEGDETRAKVEQRAGWLKATTRRRPGPGDRPPLIEVLDMSKGKTSPLPQLHLPGSSDAMKASADFYDALADQAREYDDQVERRFEAAEDRLQEEYMFGSKPKVVRERMEDMYQLSDLLPPWGTEAEEEALREESSRLADVEPCEGHGQWLAYMAHETAFYTRLNDVQYPYRTALAANAGEPVLNEFLNLHAERERAAIWETLTNEADLWAAGSGCSDDPGPMPPDAGGDTIDPGEGSPACSIPLSFGLQLGPVGFSADCESIGVSVATEGPLGGFLETSYAPRSGEVTVYGGARAGAGLEGLPFSGEVKSGVYVTAGSDGISDVGIRGTISGSAGIGPASVAAGDQLDFSFVGAFQ